MMTTNGFQFLPIGWHVHIVFVTLVLLGLILFLRWAFLALDKKSLINWIIWLLVVGVIGVFLTSGWGVSGTRYMFSGGHHGGTGGMMGSFGNTFEKSSADFDNPDEWRDYMLEEMAEHMGF